MKITREFGGQAIDIELTMQELMDAHDEYASNWMKSVVESKLYTCDEHIAVIVEMAMENWRKGDGRTQYDCVTDAISEYGKELRATAPSTFEDILVRIAYGMSLKEMAIFDEYCVDYCDMYIYDDENFQLFLGAFGASVADMNECYFFVDSGKRLYGFPYVFVENRSGNDLPNQVFMSFSNENIVAHEYDTIKMIVVPENTIKEQAQLEKEFAEFPEEIRWGDYAGAFVEYLHIQQQKGDIIPLKANDFIASSEIYSPSGYAYRVGIKGIKDTITLEEFDRVLSEKGLWNYPLSEYSEIVANHNKVVLVKFESNYRFVEVPQ